MCKRILVLLVWITSYAVCSGSSICDAVNDGLIVGDKFGEWSCDPVHCNNCKCLSTATSNDCPFAPTETKCGSMYRGTNYLQRGYDLSEFKNPILSVSFRAYNYCEASDCISLSYSCDGGSTYTSSISYDATDITFGTVYTPSISLMGCAGKNNVYIRIKARCQDFRFNNVCIKDEIPICDAVNDGLKVGDNPGQWSCDPVHCNNCKCLSTAISNDCPFAPEIIKCGSMYRGSDYLEREYDLSGFNNPVLSFSFRAYNYCEASDCVSISYSTDGGVTYTKAKSYDASDIVFGKVYTPSVALPNQSQQNIRIRIKGRCQDFRFNNICVAEGDAPRIPLSAENCNAFYQTDDLTLSKNNEVGTVVIDKYIEVEFDMKINSLPPYSYYNIFHIGNLDVERMPAIWIRGEQHVAAWTVHETININSWYPDGNNPDIDLTNPAPKIGKHHIYLGITPTNYYLTINDAERVYYGNFDRSNYIGKSMKIYFSDPWFNAVDATLSNICIRSSSDSLYPVCSSDESSSKTIPFDNKPNIDYYSFNALFTQSQWIFIAVLIGLIIILFICNVYGRKNAKYSKVVIYSSSDDNQSL